jgi:hypothetical protein
VNCYLLYLALYNSKKLCNILFFEFRGDLVCGPLSDSHHATNGMAVNNLGEYARVHNTKALGVFHLAVVSLG